MGKTKTPQGGNLRGSNLWAEGNDNSNASDERKGEDKKRKGGARMGKTCGLGGGGGVYWVARGRLKEKKARGDIVRGEEGGGRRGKKKTKRG